SQRFQQCFVLSFFILFWVLIIEFLQSDLNLAAGITQEVIIFVRNRFRFKSAEKAAQQECLLCGGFFFYGNSYLKRAFAFDGKRTESFTQSSRASKEVDDFDSFAHAVCV